jgi:aryl-alcohol dehydrogenase-like predicted oxidoreductase
MLLRAGGAANSAALASTPKTTKSGASIRLHHAPAVIAQYCGRDRALWESDRHGYARYDSLQPHYNLAHGDEFERELEPLCLEQGLGVIPYSPLAAGFLTGKYHRGQELPRSRRAEGIRRRYLNERGFALLDEIDKVDAAHHATTAQVALAWLLARPVITAPIIGANSVQQLRETLTAGELRLDMWSPTGRTGG